MPKSTDAEMAIRLDELELLVVGGATRSQIVRYASDKWGVGERQVDTYLHRVAESLKMQSVFSRKERLGTALSRLDNLFKNCMAAKDYATALQVCWKQIKLLGLDKRFSIEELERVIKLETTLSKPSKNLVADDEKPQSQITSPMQAILRLAGSSDDA